MTADELRKALEKIPEEGAHNKARRAEIIKKITALQKLEQEEEGGEK